EAGDVIGLTGGADKLSYLLHEVLQSCLGGKIGKISNDLEPALVGELLAGGVKGFDDAIGKEDEGVSRLQIDGSGYESGFAENAERQTARFEAFYAAIFAANDGRIVPGIHIEQATRRWIIFANHRGGETAAFEAVGASIVIQSRCKLHEGKTLRSECMQAGLQGGHEERSGDALAG